jgi:hypothetical protein
MEKTKNARRGRAGAGERSRMARSLVGNVESVGAEAFQHLDLVAWFILGRVDSTVEAMTSERQMMG